MQIFPALAFCYVADAAFVCSCGARFTAAQQVSPNQPLKASLTHKIRAALSQQVRANILMWTKCDFEEVPQQLIIEIPDI